MKTSILKIYVVVFCLLSNFALFAQPVEETPEDTPINGMVIWLAMAGIVTAFFVLRKKAKTV